MSDIPADVQRTIDTILRLTNDGSVVSLTSACKDYLCKKVFPGGELKPGISISVIPRVLSTILKCLKSKNSTLQQEGAFFIDAIVCTSDEGEHAKLVIDKGVIPLLIKNLSSKVIKVLDQTLSCLGKIAFHYPRDVIENGICEPLYKCLQSKNELIVFQSVKFLAILLSNCEAKISDILDADSFGPLLRAIKRHDSDEDRYSLVNYLSPDFNDEAALESLKAIFNWLLAEKPKEKTDYDLSDDRKIIKLLALKLVKNAISLYGEDAVDVIERENFLPPILTHVYGATKNVDIKIEAVSVIDDIIVVEPDFLLSLIDNYDIISLLSKNLSIENVRLVEIILQTLKNAIEKCQDACRRKIKDFGSRAVLEKLGEHENEEIKQLSKDIQDFIDVSHAAAVDESDNEVEVIEPNIADVDSRIALVERPQTRQHSRQHQKRRATPFPDVTRKKKSKTSNGCNDNEHSDSSANDDNDIGDHPEIFSSQNLHSVAAAPAETNRNTFPGRQSIVASTGDGTTENGFNVGHQFPPGDDRNQLTGPPASHVPDYVPQVASINVILTEIKPTPQPPSSVIKMIIPVLIETTQDSSQIELQEQSVAENVTAASADETPPNNLNPRSESSISADLSTSSSRHSSTTTHHGTPSRTEIQPPPPPRHQSLAHQNVAAAIDGTQPNNLNPRSERSTSGNLSRSSSRVSSALPPLTATTNHGSPSTLPHVKEESLSIDLPSPTRPPYSPGLPEGSVTDERNQSLSQTPSRASLQFSAGTSRNNNYFAPFRYFYPGEEFMSKCCEEKFGLKYYRFRQKILDFVKKINIHQHVDITSKPFSHPTNDETGFGCISMLFTGTENYLEIIRKQINANYVKLFEYDQKKFTTVINSSFLLKEHLETICRWLECRVMVYYNEKWKLYGDWNGENLPLFLLEKKRIKEKEIYQVVLSVVIDVSDD